MNKFRFTLIALAVMALTLMASSSTQAQASRTWVSGVGDDANPCSRTAPCKTFAGAISKTLTAGEISVLDPGGFGTLTITKGITINGEGTLAGVLNTSVPGFTISAPNTDTVNINYVSINAPGNGTNGIRVNSAKNVNIGNVTISGQSGNGIEILASADVQMYINNTTIRNCAGAAFRADTSAGFAKVQIENSSFLDSGSGINARRNSRVAVKDSSISHNGIGAFSEDNGGGASVIYLESCMVSFNAGNGVQAGGGLASGPSIVRMSDNEIINSGAIGVAILANGSVDTFMNNEITGNGTNGCPSCTNASGSFN